MSNYSHFREKCFVLGKSKRMHNLYKANQSKAVFILWEDGYDVLRHPGQGIGVNTEPDAPYVTPDNVYFYRVNHPVGLGVLGNTPYNPFIFVDGDRGREVHLADRVPTNLADQSFFYALLCYLEPDNEYFLL